MMADPPAPSTPSLRADPVAHRDADPVHRGAALGLGYLDRSSPDERGDVGQFVGVRKMPIPCCPAVLIHSGNSISQQEAHADPPDLGVDDEERPVTRDERAVAQDTGVVEPGEPAHDDPSPAVPAAQPTAT